MRIRIGLGLGARIVQAGAPPSSAPTLRLVLAPAAPQPGDLVRLTGLVSGTPLPTGLSPLTVTAGGAAVPLAGTGLQRSFVARPGALAVSASVTTSEGTAADTLAATVPPGQIVSDAETLSLGWAAVPEATGYTVEAGLAGTYAFSRSAVVPGTSHNFTGLAPGAYVGRIRAEFAEGLGPWRF